MITSTVTYNVKCARCGVSKHDLLSRESAERWQGVHDAEMHQSREDGDRTAAQLLRCDAFPEMRTVFIAHGTVSASLFRRGWVRVQFEDAEVAMRVAGYALGGLPRGSYHYYPALATIIHLSPAYLVRPVHLPYVAGDEERNAVTEALGTAPA